MPPEDPSVRSVHQSLLREGLVVPVRLDGEEERRWLDCDLASFAENRIGIQLDPRHLSDAQRVEIVARATDQAPWPLSYRSQFEVCYWLLDRDERIGTVGLSRDASTPHGLHLSSFYLLPPYRGRGLGLRALQHVRAAARADRLALHLDTNWCWQRAVRFYLAAGMWLSDWKYDLCFFYSPAMPNPILEIASEEASLSVAFSGKKVRLCSARRKGDNLVLHEDAKELGGDSTLRDAAGHASTTLSLAIAMHGWPLIRRESEWRSTSGAESCDPEGLLDKIVVWEAWARSRGWTVCTPKIPGFRYPTWEELKAQWATSD